VVVAAFGGSLGSRTINQAVTGLVGAWAARRDVLVYHVVGRRDWASGARAAATEGYRPVEYEERMPLLLAAADVAVCRAGGSTVAELAVAGLPSVLVPLPGAPGDHQTANAAALVQAGAAVPVPDAALTPERLARELDALVGDHDRLEAMGRAARSCAVPDAANRVAMLLDRYARRGAA
jgi:UDP-N-acetylglucosamine:LPS N-acetylglucosamine transferase